MLHTEIGGQVACQTKPSERGGYGAFYRNLYADLTEGGPLAVNARQVAQVLGLIEKAYESVQTGRRIKV
ncbi:Gfo/Idh/MocA family oxidoreductase [Neisseria yangbaofengii]|uniref:Gfo/Idh/MocA family oxidoreductase n=1 Tax=Neisseria yangbaofengii TaxID=2709396 RepID=UPI0013ED39EA|nr:Gfo/Idh/MocA family oxidoreductase [Neisseria yangbaofengii]